MPELPEVETVRNRLKPHLLNHYIKNVDTYIEKYKDIEKIKNQKVCDILRKGKYLIFKLEDFYLISHLRMEGKYFVRDEKTKHDLVKFNFDDFTLYYNDVRKFGVFYLFNINDDIYNMDPLNKVGDEPWDIDENFLYSSLIKRKDYIKEALLDQSLISGLGNIYADEVLFLSKINPYRRSNTISLIEATSIKNNSIVVLRKAIDQGGSTIRSFESFNGEIGHFQTSLNVHLREHERCNVCNNYILKDRCGGRGTYYCPTCQRRNKTKLIAITGSYSSGKSTVLKRLNNLGYHTYSTDDLYNELLVSNKGMIKDINKIFNTTDKSKIKEIIFNDSTKNEELIKITHRYVMEYLFRKIEKDDTDYIFIEVPLLFEGLHQKEFDKIVCVSESEKVKEIILKAKGIDKKTNNDFLLRQINIKNKKEESDFVLYNNNTIEELYLNIDKMLKEIK